MSAFDVASEILSPLIVSSDAKQALSAAKCYGLMVGYHARWKESRYRIDGVETVMTSDLINPETQRKSRTFRLAGKIDVRATDLDTNQQVIIDHKTTSVDISDPNGSYWRQLAVEGQASMYLWLEWMNGIKAAYALWDVIRKATISPKALTKAEKADLEDRSTYFGWELMSQEMERFQAEGRETPFMYAARLAHDCSQERPAWYFQRRKIPRLDSEMLEFAGEIWDIGQDILATRASGRHLKNGGACMLYGSPCKFLGVCSKHDSIDSGAWKLKEQVHAELPAFENRGLDILTNSRARTYQTCKKLHDFKYEQGVERVEEEDREALLFGQQWHEVLEAYFLEIQNEQKKAGM